MVAADTVVGIAGVVVLVAVMAGVFVYEYNNAPEPDPTDAFRQRHPAMDPAGDVDGDGIANMDDDDLDGDGTDDADDDNVTVTDSFAGSMQPTQTDPFLFDVHVENGSMGIRVRVTYDVIAPPPAPPVPAFQVSLVGPDGEEVATGSTNVEGQTATAEVVLDAPPEAGTHQVRIVQQDSGVGGSFEGVVAVAYA